MVVETLGLAESELAEYCRRKGVFVAENVAENVGETGEYENVSEYIRDLVRRDKERKDQESLERLKAELAYAFEAPESSYRPLTAADVIARNRT